MCVPSRGPRRYGVVAEAEGRRPSSPWNPTARFSPPRSFWVCIWIDGFIRAVLLQRDRSVGSAQCRSGVFFLMLLGSDWHRHNNNASLCWRRMYSGRRSPIS